MAQLMREKATRLILSQLNGKPLSASELRDWLEDNGYDYTIGYVSTLLNDSLRQGFAGNFNMSSVEIGRQTAGLQIFGERTYQLPIIWLPMDIVVGKNICRYLTNRQRDELPRFAEQILRTDAVPSVVYWRNHLEKYIIEKFTAAKPGIEDLLMCFGLKLEELKNK